MTVKHRLQALHQSFLNSFGIKSGVKHGRDDGLILDEAIVNIIGKTRHNDAMKMLEYTQMCDEAWFNLLESVLKCSLEARPSSTR